MPKEGRFFDLFNQHAGHIIDGTHELFALMDNVIDGAWIRRRTSPWRVDKWFRRLQLVSASLYNLGHGGNDAQKTIGISWCC